MGKVATGIEIGSRTAKALRGTWKGGDFQLQSFVLGEAEGSSIADRWAALPGEAKLSRARVALTGKDMNVRYTRVPRVPDWQLRKLMRFEVAEIGESSGEGVASDFNLLPEIPEAGGEDIVLLAMARESLLEEHLEGAREAGASVESFTPSAVALYNAWLHFGVVQDDTVLIADIGHDNMDVAIVRGPDLLFARNLSGGGELFDQAIAAQLKVSPQQAAQLKHEHANLKPGARAATPNGERVQRAMQGAAGQILSLLQSAVLFCKTQIRISGLKIHRVQLCGGSAAIEGLSEYLSRGMSVPVEVFDPFERVETGGLPAEQQERLEEYRLEAVTALGLAAMGADPDSYSLEILPAAVAEKREFWGGKVFLIAAAVLAVAYLGWYALDRKERIATGEVQANRLARQVRSAQSADRRTRELLTKNEILHNATQELLWSHGTGQQAQALMGFLAQSMPDDFWVTQLKVGRAVDEELGLTREAGERPVVRVKGKARDSAVSPTVQHRDMIAALQGQFPTASLNHTVDRTNFGLDLTFFADRPAVPEDEDADSE